MASSATEPKIDAAKAAAAAEKAYAVAAAQVDVKPASVEAPKVEAVTAPVEAPKAEVVTAPAPAKAAPVAKPVAAKVAPKKKVVAAKKPAPAKQAAPAPVAAKKAAKPVATKKSPAKQTVAKKIMKASAKPVADKPTPIAKLKDTIMTKTKTTTEDFTAKISTAVADAQDKAKAAMEKSQALLSDAGEFTKGNVEAIVASGKILAAGFQDMGKAYVAEGKTALETVTADVKELAAVKSPTDFFKLQGEILRRNFDAAVATGSKNSEAVVKLANEAFAPLSTRVSLAVEKMKKAA